MEVQKRVADYINGHGIRQVFVCEKAGIKRDRMSNIMTLKSKLTADEFVAICEAIHKTPNDFMMGA